MGKKRHEPVKVTVCTWDPAHTLKRVLDQEQARRDGTLAKIVKEAGGDKAKIRAAMVKARLNSMGESLNGDVHCPECGTLMESVYASPGVVGRVAAYEDVVQDFSGAIDRTRSMR